MGSYFISKLLGRSAVITLACGRFRSLGLSACICCMLMPLSQQVVADDWGFSLQGGGGARQLELTYSIADNERHLREWYFGCRQITLSSDLSGLSDSADDALDSLTGEGCGIAFSWRYLLRGGYFVGVRNGWWRTFYQHKDADDEVLAKSRIDSLAPSLITGWKLGNDKFSADIFIGLGREFNLVTEEESVGSFNTFSGGITFRF